jgi:hypothetical protein
MDWQNTNGNTEVEWWSRNRPTNASQATTAGVALEHMIELSNILGASPWFCLSYAATDDYITQFATLVKATLRPDVKVIDSLVVFEFKS